ncbi:MAG: hypothetical protein M3O28_14520 [Actinomycetota bacterium]|nr:hypothetical protein [Actinomycetota bacterium]
MSDDDAPDTAPSVIWSVAAGVGPLPFLAVYAVIFLAHGFLYPVQPPDITSTRSGEAVAGVVAVLVAVLIVATIWSFMNGRRRWPFVISQLGVLATTVDFIADARTGSPAVPAGLLLTSTAAIVLAFLPASWAHVGRRQPRWFGARRVARAQAGRRGDPRGADIRV